MARLTRTVVPRGYEVGRTGVLPAATLARYLEHLRWEALEDPTFGFRRLFAGGSHMVVRAQCLALGVPVGVGRELVASMWVERIGRTSFDIGHRIERVSDGAEVAAGVVTGVYLDPRGRPQPIPDAIRALAEPAGLPAVERLATSAPEGSWSVDFPVRPSDIDLLQHVNHAKYVDYVDDARLLAAGAGAYGDGARRAEGPARRLVIEYIGQAVMGDRVHVLTWPIPAEPAAFAFELWRGPAGDLLVRARVEVAEDTP